jgi:hypothetical protein
MKSKGNPDLFEALMEKPCRISPSFSSTVFPFVLSANLIHSFVASPHAGVPKLRLIDSAHGVTKTGRGMECNQNLNLYFFLQWMSLAEGRARHERDPKRGEATSSRDTIRMWGLRICTYTHIRPAHASYIK